MSEDTQSRLKAFLNRNKNRISGPGSENEETKTVSANPSKTISEKHKFDSPYTKPASYNQLQSPEQLINDMRTSAKSNNYDDENNEMFNSNAEYKPISLFDVIHNTPFAQGQMSTVNNSTAHYDSSRMHLSGATSVANHSPEKKIEYNFNSINERKPLANPPLEKEYISKKSHENFQSPAQYKSEKETFTTTSYGSGNYQPKFIEAKETKGLEFASTESLGYDPKRDKSPLLVLKTNKENKDLFKEKVAENNILPAGGSNKQQRTNSAKIDSRQNKLAGLGKAESRSPDEVRHAAEENQNFKRKTEKPTTESFYESATSSNIMHESEPSDVEFKKEIKNLIQVIKHEKDQVVQDLKVMADDLNKYKLAFKKLQQGKHKPSQIPEQSNSPREGILTDSKNQVNLNRIDDSGQSRNYESHTKTYESTNTRKQHSVSKQTPMTEIVNRPENILSCNLVTSRSMEFLQDHELSRNAVNQFVIQDMNLSPTWFYKNNQIDAEANCKPTIIDLVASQREMIQYLVKKHQNAEQRRLKTEEQASKMVLSMEKTIKNLEEKEYVSRQRTSPSPRSVSRKR